MSKDEFDKILRELLKLNSIADKIKYLETKIFGEDYDNNGFIDELICIYKKLKNELNNPNNPDDNPDDDGTDDAK